MGASNYQRWERDLPNVPSDAANYAGGACFFGGAGAHGTLFYLLLRGGRGSAEVDFCSAVDGSYSGKQGQQAAGTRACLNNGLHQVHSLCIDVKHWRCWRHAPRPFTQFQSFAHHSCLSCRQLPINGHYFSIIFFHFKKSCQLSGDVSFKS